MTGHVIFETAIGPCGMAWTQEGVACVRLPGETDLGRTLANQWPSSGDPEPDWLPAAVAAIQDLLAGRKVDLGFIPVDLTQVPEFHRRVYAVARSIPPGRGMTYGDVAAALGEPGAARAVGQALGRNPIPIVIPCHRVLAAGGRAGGFSAPGGAASKLKLLAIEGYSGTGPTLFDLT